MKDKDLLAEHQYSEGHGHHHDHGHHHGHHHHHHGTDESNSKIVLFSVVLNLLFVAVEGIVGWSEDSLSLLSDAGHNLSDVFSLLLVLVGFSLAKVKAKPNYTYGYKKSTVLISLTNAVILLVAVVAIVMESINKFCHPSAEVNGAAISWTATVGIVINAATAFLLMKGQKSDLNMRGAFLHMVADTLVSLGVVVSGIIIIFTGWVVVDPIISLVIAVVILVSTWELLSDSMRLILEGAPEGIDPKEVVDKIHEIDKVSDLHHVHIWALSTTENAMTAHVVVDKLEDMNEVKCRIKRELSEMHIGHSTLEFETKDSPCEDITCS